MAKKGNKNRRYPLANFYCSECKSLFSGKLRNGFGLCSKCNRSVEIREKHARLASKVKIDPK